MGEYISTFLKTKLSGVKNTIVTGTSQLSSAVFGSLTKVKSYLGQAVTNAEVLNETFIDSITPSDSLIEKGAILESSSIGQFTTKVTDESVFVMKEGFNKLSEIYNSSACVITDSKGNPYKMVFFGDGDDTLIPGYVVYAAICEQPTSLSECIAYSKVDSLDELFVNEIIPTMNYTADRTQTTLKGKLDRITTRIHWMFDVRDPNVPEEPYVFDTILQACQYLAEKIDEVEEPYDTCLESLQNCDYFWPSIASCNTLEEAIDMMYNSTEHLSPTSLAEEDGPHGAFSTLYDILYDSVESDAINSALLDMSTILISGGATIADFNNLALSKSYEKYSSVRSVVNHVKDAFKTSGIYAAASALIDIIKGAATITEKDGAMAFTDNSRYIPTEYIAGIVTGLFEALSAVVSVIGIIIGQVVGAVVAALGFIASHIFKAISYSAECTRAGIQDSEDVLFPLAPYGILQYEFTNISSEYNSDLLPYLQYVQDYGSCIALDIPGGQLFIGPGKLEDDGSLKRLRVEFHPSIDDKRMAVATVLNNMDAARVTYEYYDYADATMKVSNLKLDFGYAVRDAIINAWSQDPLYHDWKNDSSDAGSLRLNTEQDGRMQSIVEFNTWLFLYFLQCCSVQNEHYVRNYGYEFFDHTIAVYHIIGNRWDWSDNYYHSHWSVLYHLAIWCPIFTYNATSSGSTYSGVVYNENNPDPTKTTFGLKKGWTGYTEDLQYINEQLPNGTIVTSGLSGLRYMLQNNLFYGDPFTVPSRLEWALVPPKYNATTFYTWLILTGVVLVAATVAIVAATVRWRQVRRAKRAQQNAQVEKAWEEVKKNPSDPVAYKNYRKTVKQSRRSRLMYGGTKYDYENYWNGDCSGKGNNAIVTSGFLSDLNSEADLLNDGSLSKLERITHCLGV